MTAYSAGQGTPPQWAPAPPDPFGRPPQRPVPPGPAWQPYQQVPQQWAPPPPRPAYAPPQAYRPQAPLPASWPPERPSANALPDTAPWSEAGADSKRSRRTGNRGADKARPGRRRGTMWLSLVVGILVATALVLGGFYFYARAAAPAATPTTAAVVGDCVTPSGTDLKTVACGTPTATYQVVGRVEDKTQVEAGMSACSAHPETTDAFWQGRSGQRGLVLCLVSAKVK